MCVILACINAKPSDDMIKKAEAANKDGGGIAWIEGDKVRWAKGIDAKEITKIVHAIKLPFVIHFRIATAGGIRKDLCHPFPVTESVSLELTGKANQVLFHNGMWKDWEDRVLQLAISNKIRVPDGAWSDSRALAWLAAIAGRNSMTFVDEKIAILNKAGVVYMYGSWIEDGGIYLSNSYFKTTYYGTRWNAKDGRYDGYDGADWTKTGTAVDDPADEPSAIETFTQETWIKFCEKRKLNPCSGAELTPVVETGQGALPPDDSTSFGGGEG